jgi:hypothetical protein
MTEKLAPAIFLSYFIGRMKVKQKIILFIFTVISFGVISTPMVLADDTCAGVKTAIIHCDQTGQGSSAKDSGIWGLLLIALNILTGGVGILAVGGIVYGAILYSSAADRADQVKKAISIITNVIIGVAAYGLMYILLNFLIPGGIFS